MISGQADWSEFAVKVQAPIILLNERSFFSSCWCKAARSAALVKLLLPYLICVSRPWWCVFWSDLICFCAVSCVVLYLLLQKPVDSTCKKRVNKAFLDRSDEV